MAMALPRTPATFFQLRLGLFRKALSNRYVRLIPAFRITFTAFLIFSAHPHVVNPMMTPKMA
ncbi:hypothetical protein OG875_07895 [Streptomyces sp. NBC_01498]|uniref:hypothetical protein n=1 Tax=Streptomyces sp. NBC_01498 TaxID=2975870 RepID=UPI002E7B6F58|nr:hypothetical protein [Streptomyces sp. NBC_01498]WTL24528.1 hypothetical protein OG875_07895 [Streptomyces sp. NBC_01498]